MTGNSPVAADLLAVSVSVLLELVAFGANDAVTPFGRPLANKVTLWSNVFLELTVTVTVPLLPRAIVRLVGFAVSVNVPSGFTVRAIVVVAVRLPEVPVMVTVAVPVLAALLAVNVTTLDEVAGLPLKVAVTPFGSPVAVSVTLPENPFTGAIVIVLAPLPTPCVIVTTLGVAKSVKC